MASRACMLAFPMCSVLWRSRFNARADNTLSKDYDQLTYPLKPHRSEIRKFWNFMEMLHRHRRVLIIGSNPELRDIAFITDKEVTCCDIDSQSITTMRRFMKYRKYINAQSERQIDWLMDAEDLTIGIGEDDKYDLILSIDGHLNALPLSEWDVFLDRICDRLKNNGFFILRATNKPPGDWTELSPEEIFSDWLHSKYRDDVGMLFIKLLLFCSHSRSDGKFDGTEWK